ncbi:MAG: flagellar hook-associated protein FlgL [Planctomycetota bacterium]
MRITDSMTFNVVLQGQTRANRRLLDASRSASTGERVSAPSDDPVAWATAVNQESRISRLESRSSTVIRAADDLAGAESLLDQAGSYVQQAREITLAAANGAIDPNTRASLSRQINDIRTGLLGIANSRGVNGFLFAGTRTDTAPFTATGAFTGNDTALSVEIADGVSIRANASGARAFTAAGGRDIFADLQSLATALTANNLTDIRSAITNLDAGHQQIVSTRIDAGIGVERLRSASEVADTARTNAATARAAAVEADYPTVLSELTNARGAYERNIAVTREILQVSTINRF